VKTCLGRGDVKTWLLIATAVALTSVPVWARPRQSNATPARGQAQTPGTQAQAAPVGGLQLDIQPRQAQVFVDGQYAGVVDEFRGYYQHLELRAGPHRVEVFAPGYQPLLVDLMIVPGRTRVYRNTLPDLASD